MIENGHEIGHHMTSDEPSYRLSDSAFSKKFKRADRILSKYGQVRWFRPGSIIILHDRGDRGKRTIKTLKHILPKLKARGYRFVTLSKLYDSKIE